MKINVSSETGTLRSLIIHSPDSGIGRVAPSKAQDWLFEDILHLETVRKKEYDYYVKLLMYFLDPGKIKGRISDIDSPANDREFFKPSKPGFHSSDKVIEMERLLSEILEDEMICLKLTSAVCAIEGCSYALQTQLSKTPASELARVFISGTLNSEEMIFPPIPNLIFTRDIGIVINDHILLNKPAKKARARETLLARYIFFNHPIFSEYRNKILEIPDTVKYFLRPGDDPGERTTIEGGDVMVVSKDHILIGCSERTSSSGANEAIKLLFERGIAEKVTVIKIPPKRDYMHIDTLFTQVSRNTWVVFAPVATLQPYKGKEAIDYLSEKRNKEKPEILQFRKDRLDKPETFPCLEALLKDISENDLNSGEETRFIYSGNNEFPFDAREQWTDSCNVLALKEGVVLGYDRNDKTIEAFRLNGFSIIHAGELLNGLEEGKINIQTINKTLILMPSAELSRARGGFHCMSMPLHRDEND